VKGGRGRDFCVATDDGIDGNDVANGGPGRDVYDADAGDVLVSVEAARDCWIGARIPRGGPPALAIRRSG
jgi:Ca2+-binding RTX toxin-like protein